MAAGAARTPFDVRADSIEACSCRHACNCQFEGTPTEGKCDFVVGFVVRAGRFGDLPLDGLKAVVAARYPGAIHEGNGHVVLFVDDAVSEAQAAAFATIMSGKEGGMPWEALAATVARFDGPIRRAIDIHLAGERSTVQVRDAVDVRLTPIKDVVTGAEKDIHITYPKGGFFWDEGAIATTDAMRAEYGDLQMEWPRRYAAAAQVRWSNQ
jgi:hypothetical protein